MDAMNSIVRSDFRFYTRHCFELVPNTQYVTLTRTHRILFHQLLDIILRTKHSTAHSIMPPFNHYSFQYPQAAGKRTNFMLPIQRLPRLNTNFNDSEESLQHLIQHPSPKKRNYPPHAFSQIKRKSIPGAGRPDSATLPDNPSNKHTSTLHRPPSSTLGSFDTYRDPFAQLKKSREDLLTQKLVPGVFSSNPSIANASQDKVNGIKMRVEPDLSIRSPVSPLGMEQSEIYQRPADLSYLPQSLHDPASRLRVVRAEQKLKRGSHVSKGAQQPKARLQQRLKAKAAGEFVVAKSIRLERSQLQQTKQWLNGRNENIGYNEPLLTSREKEDSLADMFDREYKARMNGERTRLGVQKLKELQHLYVGRTGLVEKAMKYERRGMLQEDFSGWYGESRKRDRAFKKVKIVLAKMLRPGSEFR